MEFGRVVIIWDKTKHLPSVSWRIKFIQQVAKLEVANRWCSSMDEAEAVPVDSLLNTYSPSPGEVDSTGDRSKN
jgi:hypothetical protein